MRLSLISAALVAALVGYGSSVAILLAAAQAVGATPAQTASWVTAVCIAKGIGSGLLSTWKRVPIVLAWSTAGAAVIAASTGININEAVGAFIFAALLTALTGMLPPINRLVSGIPTGIASGMLAGVLLPFCMAVAEFASSDGSLVLPLIATFLVVRLINPLFAVLVALAGGVVIAVLLTDFTPPVLRLDTQPFVFVMPAFDLSVMLGLGLPVYLVTMASQNLPGFAVLRANGYEAPAAAALGVTGIGSAIAGLFGGHTFSMASITAAICVGDDVHPDRTQRWKVGLVYGAIWIMLGILGPIIIPTILTLPKSIVATVAGLALIVPLIGAISSAFEEPDTRFAAAVTLIVTASGVAAFGISAAFWGLVAGLVIFLMAPLQRS